MQYKKVNNVKSNGVSTKFTLTGTPLGQFNVVKLYAVLLLGLGLTGLQAQEVVTTAGSHGETTSGSLSWTVGEPVIETITDGTNTLTQGFQQSRLTVTAINDLKVPGIEMSVYPNPTNSFLFIEVKTDKQRDLLLSLFDLNGKLILQKRMTGNKQTIKMQNYKSGTYILKVMEAKDSTDAKFCVSTFRIIKK